MGCSTSAFSVWTPIPSRTSGIVTATPIIPIPPLTATLEGITPSAIPQETENPVADIHT